MKSMPLERKYQILNSLKQIPRKMLQLHGTPNVTEFVLHELCQEHCFNIPKAAYFIDNPDFNCLKGIAGFSRNEQFHLDKDIWKDAHEFTKYMQNASFNNQVRSFVKESLRRKGENDVQIVHEIAQNLELENPGFFSWDMKHHNHGLFIYEKHNLEDDVHDSLVDGLCLLGFCPVF